MSLNEKKFCGIKFIFILIVLIFGGCNDNPPQPPPIIPEISADFSGECNLNFQARMSGFKNPRAGIIQVSYTGIYKYNGIKYGFTLSVFYLDSIIKTGTFQFTNSTSSIPTDYAIAAITIGKDPNRRDFISDSGSITIFSISLNEESINAKFNFDASEINGTGKISVKNGILDK